MKKRILIAIYSLGMGGGEKALVNMLNALPHDIYDIELQLFENIGPNLAFLPEYVHLREPLFPNGMLSSKEMVLHLLKRGEILSAIRRVVSILLTRNKPDRVKSFYAWKTIKTLCQQNQEHYDIAISGMHGLSTYYVMDSVQADRKIAWVHTDYSKIAKIERELSYFERADKVITVSANCRASLAKAFPKLTNICVLQNFHSPELLRKRAYELTKEQCFSDNYQYHFLSVGRLIRLKGFDMAIEAASILKKDGISFRWYILGQGDERDHLIKQSEEAGVSENICFMGIKENPYPYIYHADIVVQTSRYEGKSMVLDEAKILNKVIVSTSYDSVTDQIQNGMNGIIVPISPSGIADGIKTVLENTALCIRIRDRLKAEEFDTERLLQEYYHAFEGDI